MKAFFKYFFIVIGGSVATVVLLAVLMFLLMMIPEKGEKYSQKQVVASFTKHEESFETVRQFIDGFDFSAYPESGHSVPYIIIIRPDTLPDAAEYEIDVTADKVYLEQIGDTAVNAALDRLYRKAHIYSILQTQDEQNRSVFFQVLKSGGVVYSRSGDEPADWADDAVYAFSRVNEHWFYWTKHWD